MRTSKNKFKIYLAVVSLAAMLISTAGASAATRIGSNINSAGDLTVDGALKFTSGAANNYVLASDASGNAAWISVATLLDSSHANVTTNDLDEGTLNLYYDSADVETRIDNRSGIVGGFAPLDAGLKVPSSYLPNLVITNVYAVADIAARDLLTVEEGDVAVVADAGLLESRSYIYDGTGWLELKAPVDLYLAAANDLSDLGNFATARTNLGIGTTDIPEFNGLTLNSLTADSFIYSGTGGLLTSTAAPLDGELLIGVAGSSPVVATLTGTTNQVDVTNGAGSITLSTPQDIDTSASPQFTGLTLSGTTLSINGIAYAWPAADGALGDVLTTDGAGALTWTTVAGAGETNTASNVNVGGQSLFKQKTGVDLEFRGINAASNKIGIALDDPNNEVTIDVNEANLTLDNLGGTLSETHGGTNLTTYTSGDILYASAADTLSALPIGGTDGWVLTVNTGAPVWQALPGAGAETDPVFTGSFTAAGDLLVGTGAGTYTAVTDGTSGQFLTTNGSGALSWAAETDPVYTAWDKSTGISITESQISDLQAYLTSETDSVFTGSFTAAGDLLVGTGAGTYTAVTDGTSGQFLTTNGSGALSWAAETDPVYTAWDKSTGISITESQISDLQAYLTSETDSVFTGSFTAAGDLLVGTGAGTYTAVTDGTSGQFLTTNGSGALSWAAETDPVYTAWDKSTGISITESQISDLQAYLTSETDSVFTGSFTAAGDLLVGTGAGTYTAVTDGTSGQFLTTNGSGALSWAAETDPVYTAWDKSTGISITESQISDLQAYLTSETDSVFTGSFTAAGDLLVGTGAGTYTAVTDGTSGQFLTTNGSGALSWAAETDPVYTAWDKSTGISITESQISDLQAYLTSETDSVFTGSFTAAGDLLVGTGAGTYTAVTDGTSGQFLTTNGSGALSWAAETDPVYTVWDKSTGISITESQISDLQTYALSGANGDITSLTGLTTALGPTYGGTGLATYALGDILYASAANTLSALSSGGAGTYLKSDGAGGLTWATPAGSGTITAVGDITTGAAFTPTAGADGNNLYFEGTTGNGFEVNLTAADPGSDVIVTIPATTGTLLLNTNNLSDVSNTGTARTNLGLGTGDSPQFTGLTLTSDETLNAQSDLRLADADSSNWAAFQAPTTISTNYTLTLPADDGTAGQCLTTSDGTGTLAWAACGAGSGADTALSNLASVAINTSLLPGTTESIALGSDSFNWLNLYLGNGGVVFEGATGGVDTNETTLVVTDPTADRTITLPNATGTVLLNTNNLSDVSNTGTARTSLGLGTGDSPQFTGLTLTSDETLNAQSDLRFADADSSNWAAFQAPTTIASNYTLTMPADDGTALQFLQTDGSGVLSWATPTVTSVAFSGITNGINTTATMTVGSGATLAPSGTGIITATRYTGSGSSTNEVDLGTAEVAGTLTVVKGGTGITDFTGATGSLPYFNSETTMDFTNAGTNNKFLKGVTGGAPAFASVDLSSPDVTSTLPIVRGGTAATTIGSAGRVVYSTGTAYGTSSATTELGHILISGTSGTGAPSWLAQGASGQLLVSGGTNVAPTWTSLGSVPTTSNNDATLRSNGSAWVENTSVLISSTGGISSANGSALTINSGTTGDLGIGTDASIENINIGTGGATKTIIFGNSTGATSVAINTGTGALNLGTNAIAHITTLGSITGAASTIVQSGTGDLKIETQGTGGLKIGTNAVAQNITIGNGTGATSLVLEAGTGNIDIGSNDIARSINIGQTSTAAQAITIGNGNTGTAVDIKVGTGALNLGSNATVHTTTLGSNTSTSTTTVQSGTGGLNLTSASTGIITLDSGTTGRIDIGTNTGGKTINIGTGAAANTLNIGNNTSGTGTYIKAGNTGINISTGGAGNIDILTDSTGTMHIDTGTSGTINFGTGDSGKTINIGTGNVANTINIGNSSYATAIQLYGTGGVKIGSSSSTAILNHYSGTASLDFGATAANTCDAATITVTGAADGDTVTLGVPAALAGSDASQNFWGYVSATNTVTVKRCNVTGSPLSDPAAATVRADVWKH